MEPITEKEPSTRVSSVERPVQTKRAFFLPFILIPNKQKHSAPCLESISRINYYDPNEKCDPHFRMSQTFHNT